MDMTHLAALEYRLSTERARLAAAKSSSEREIRAVWVAQLEKEVEGERAFLGLTKNDLPNMTADEIAAELGL